MDEAYAKAEECIWEYFCFHKFLFFPSFLSVVGPATAKT